MWNILKVALITHCSVFFLAASAEPESKPLLKTVELEWESISGAELYEVQLSPFESVRAPLTFSAREPFTTIEVPMGTYMLRVRSRALSHGGFGPWGPAIPLEVATKEATPLYPNPDEKIISKAKHRDIVNFVWSPVDIADEYRLTIWTDELGAKPIQYNTKKTNKKLSLKTGREYFWTVHFISSKDIYYAQSPPKMKFTIIGMQIAPPMELSVLRKDQDRILQWKTLEPSLEFDAKLFYSYVDENNFVPVKEASLKENEWNAGPLKNGLYRLELTARAKDRASSEPAIFTFYIKPLEPEVENLKKR